MGCGVTVCWAAMTRETISRIAPMDSQERFEGFGVRVIREHGRFISKTEVQAGEHVVTARRIVVAAGSPPFAGQST